MHKRRDFLLLPLASAAAGIQGEGMREGDRGGTRFAGSILDVEGIRAGHFTDVRRPTGCTVVLAEEGAVGGVDVRGGAPGTRETDLLDPRQTVSVVHGVLLSGGSAFGLAAADGVVRYLEQKGVGFAVGRVRVPIVPAAILFDLGIGDPAIRPDAESGYQACRAARGMDARPGAATSPRDRDLEQGNVGAGAGATVGKLLGMERAMKGGTGTASIRLPDGLVVGALVAVNALGDVVDPANGRLLAGARSADGRSLADAMELLRQGKLREPREEQKLRNTTIGVVATNAALTKSEAGKVAQMAHDGLARSIRPCHMPFDGDTLFALSTGKRPHVPGSHGMVGALAADAVAAAVVSAVMHARGIPGFPASSDLRR